MERTGKSLSLMERGARDQKASGEKKRKNVGRAINPRSGQRKELCSGWNAKQSGEKERFIGVSEGKESSRSQRMRREQTTRRRKKKKTTEKRKISKSIGQKGSRGGKSLGGTGVDLEGWIVM